MKDFFTKLWATIKAFFISLWGKITAFFAGLPVKYYLYNILGLVLCSFLGLVVPGAISVPGFVLIFLGGFVGVALTIAQKKVDWFNLLAYAIGVMIIQIFIWL